MISYQDVINRMNGETMRQKNLKGFNVVHELQDGARYKCWVEKDSVYFLYKESKVHANGKYTYEHISEYISMLLGTALNVPCVNIILLENAILSQVMTNKELHTFTELSEEFSHSFHMSNLQTYNISTLLNKEYNLYYKEVVNMLLFDAFIGNSDRHPGNFMYSEDSFYPLFDNGSSLLAYVEDSAVDSILHDKNRFEAINTTKSKPVVRDGSKIIHQQLVKILQRDFPEESEDLSKSISLLNIEDILSRVSLPSNRKELLLKFLLYRQNWFKGVLP